MVLRRLRGSEDLKYERSKANNKCIRSSIFSLLCCLHHSKNPLFVNCFLLWALWLRGRASDSRLRGPGFESCAAVLKPWASFFHSTLLQSTQLYKWVPGYKQVVDMCTSSLRALIVAYGWMLPREVEMVFHWTGLPGKKCVKRFEQSWGLDTSLYKNLPFYYNLFIFTIYLFIFTIYLFIFTCVLCIFILCKHGFCVWNKHYI